MRKCLDKTQKPQKKSARFVGGSSRIVTQVGFWTMVLEWGGLEHLDQLVLKLTHTTSRIIRRRVLMKVNTIPFVSGMCWSIYQTLRKYEHYLKEHITSRLQFQLSRKTRNWMTGNTLSRANTSITSPKKRLTHSLKDTDSKK